ncbi:hypothetical protein K1719_022964 [Acacia pycnantha]|nr:hypothetical protein K1719_022964 [Acacia pycnantha]
MEYDVLLTFFCGLDEDRPRTFLENRLREAGLKTVLAEIVVDSVREMAERCRIVMVLITPELVRSQIGRLKDILSLPKTVLPFFYGVDQNHLRAHMQLPTLSDGRIFDLGGQPRSTAEWSLLFGFTLSDDLG